MVAYPHSCPFRQARSFHSLIWGDPVLAFIYSFSPQLGLRGGWGREEPVLPQLFLGACYCLGTVLKCWGCGNEQKHRFPCRLWSSGTGRREVEKTQRALP